MRRRNQRWQRLKAVYHYGASEDRALIQIPGPGMKVQSQQIRFCQRRSEPRKLYQGMPSGMPHGIAEAAAFRRGIHEPIAAPFAEHLKAANPTAQAATEFRSVRRV